MCEILPSVLHGSFNDFCEQAKLLDIDRLEGNCRGINYFISHRSTTIDAKQILRDKTSAEMTIIDINSSNTHTPERLNYDGFGNVLKPSTKKVEVKTSNIASAGTTELFELEKNDFNDNFTDLTWLYDTVNLGTTPCAFHRQAGLSQLDSPDNNYDLIVEKFGGEDDQERKEIEEEIKRKFAELEELMDKIQNVQYHKRRRRHSKRRHNSGYDVNSVSSFVNIIPTERERRLAKPIRNALLIRSAMKKAWKGSLASCCGMGCWAHWKWVNLRHVMSDYE